MSELFIGVDIGGTAVKLGVCDENGHKGERAVVATDPALASAKMLERIGDAADLLATRAGGVLACGVGTPGPLDAARRTLVSANHLPTWKDVAIPEILQSRLGIPVVLENDGNCAAWAESRIGAGRGARSVVLFTLGTGVGGGIVLEGELWSGAGGAAGAFGHLVVDPTGPLCLCGQYGCLEQYASATSVARAYGKGSAIDAYRAAAAGDADGHRAVSEACGALSLAIANTIHTLQPDVVILGGGVASAGDVLLLPVRDGVRERVRPAWLASTRIELASLGPDSGWIGAALWAAHKTSAPRPSEARTMTGRRD